MSNHHQISFTFILLEFYYVPSMHPCKDELIYRTCAIITRGLYTFYPLFEVHLCYVTFGLMYG